MKRMVVCFFNIQKRIIRRHSGLIYSAVKKTARGRQKRAVTSERVGWPFLGGRNTAVIFLVLFSSRKKEHGNKKDGGTGGNTKGLFQEALLRAEKHLAYFLEKPFNDALMAARFSTFKSKLPLGSLNTRPVLSRNSRCPATYSVLKPRDSTRWGKSTGPSLFRMLRIARRNLWLQARSFREAFSIR